MVTAVAAATAATAGARVTRCLGWLGEDVGAADAVQQPDSLFVLGLAVLCAV